MLYHRKTQNSQNCLKIVKIVNKIIQIVQIALNFKIRVYFRFMGLGQFSECGLVSCLLWLRNVINFITIYTIFNHPVNWPHHVCVPAESSPDWESGVSSLVCLCHGSVYCASSMPAVCQHARSVPACQSVIPKVSVLPWMFPGGSRGPRCPEGQDIVPLCQMAQNTQECTYGSDLFVMMILVYSSLSCEGLLAVFVTINCYSLSLFIV